MTDLPTRVLRLTTADLDEEEMDDLKSDLARSHHIVVIQSRDANEEVIRSLNDHFQRLARDEGFPRSVVLSVPPEVRVEWVTAEMIALERAKESGQRGLLIFLRDTLCDLLDLNIPEVSAAVDECVDAINRADD